jgi:bifunctional non-homologous end joining protein LigD
MARLDRYQAKRKLSQSREPPAKKGQPGPSLNFCVHKHAARRLHYDFRLEHQGVLLSWAVPKGPSLNPKEKRLAIQVEDHPLAYRHFEGVIPKGNYGAGSVMIWDQGNYTVPDAATRRQMENRVQEGLKKGHLDLILNGQKLRGAFSLIRLKQSPEPNTWLLIKKADEFAKLRNVEELNRSSASGRTMEEIAEGPLKKSVRSSMPKKISPMLATLIPKPFNASDWIFEIKWDGFRAIAFVDRGKVEFQSRKGLSWIQKFPTIAAELKKIPGQAILDGELVVLDSKGRSQFHLMQNYEKTQEGPLCYYVFDLLYQDGRDLRSCPLIERKGILKTLLKGLPLHWIRFSDHIAKKGIVFFEAAKKNKLEGIIGKKMSSAYLSRRSRDWVKIKATQSQDFVIGGFTAPRGSRKKMGALLVGVYQNHDLIYSGRVGGGFSEALLDDVYYKLKPLIRKKCPFKSEPKADMPATWVKPVLVCEVSFAEWTKDHVLRQPVFHKLQSTRLFSPILPEQC